MFLVQIWTVPFRSSGTPVQQIQSSVDGYASAMQPEVGQISARGVRFGACFADLQCLKDYIGTVPDGKVLQGDAN